MASPLPEDDFGPDLEQLGAIGGLKTRGEGYIPNIQSAYGSIIQNAPDYQYFTAPLSNRGRTTATYGGKNNLVVAPDTPIRVVDNKTGEVIYSGIGYEGAQSAIDAAKALSASGGSKANWDIQVTRPGGNKFESVSTERPDDMVGKIAGMALPIAVSFIPGLQGVGAVLANAAAGAAGAAIAGGDPLKGGIMGGLTAAGTQFLPKPLTSLGLNAKAARAVGAGLGATAGGIATGQPLDRSLLGGALAGGTTYLGGELFGGDQPQSSSDVKFNNPGDLAYGTTNAANAANNLNIIGQNAAAQLASAGLPTTSFSVFTPPSVTPSATSAPTGAPRITVTGTPVSTGAAPSFTVNLPGKGPAVGGEDLKEIEVLGKDEGYRQAEGPGFAVNTSGLTNPNISVEGQRQTPPAEDNSPFAVDVPTPSVDEIIVTGDKKPVVKDTNELSVPIDVGNTLKFVTQPELTDDIVVEGKRKDDAVPYVDPLTPRMDVTETLADIPKGPDAKKKTDLDKITDYMELAGLVLPLLGGGGGGKGSAGKYSSTGRLSSVFTDKLPTPGQNGAFTVGGLGGTAADRTLAARPVTDWYRYGMGSAMDIPAGADLSRATSPYAGYGPGTLGEETFRAVSGIPEKPVGMAHGGDMGYSRGSSRESFAVEGPGTGRSDDIPAVLSDGEYVIDAAGESTQGITSQSFSPSPLGVIRLGMNEQSDSNTRMVTVDISPGKPQ